MSRNWSLLILVGAVVGIGILFFRVIWPFLLPLLFAGVLTILFRPTYEWTCRLCQGRRRIAAALTTLGVIMIVMLPLSGLLLLAGVEFVDAGKEIVGALDLPKGTAEAKRLFNLQQYPRVAEWLDAIPVRLSEQSIQNGRELLSNALIGITTRIYEKTQGLAADLIAFLVGIIITVLGMYYLFADGDKLSREVQRISPLGEEEGRTLFRQFENVCRGVVLGTVVSAVVQGILAGIGLAIIGVDRLWLLAILTMLFSFIPFLGAAAVWICVVVVLLFEQQFGRAIFMALYGAIVVSGSDNLIKAYLIGDRAQLHPFVVLITVLGALQLVGLWGIFIGPMTAAFFYALLDILHTRYVELAPQP